MSWRRIRKKPKGVPDPVEYSKKEAELEELETQAEQGIIDLYHFDESGFCLEPYIPYAWQEKGETIEVESSGGKRLSVLGFLSLQRELVAYTTEGIVDKYLAKINFIFSSVSANDHLDIFHQI